jgi:hypothetical protein
MRGSIVAYSLRRLSARKLVSRSPAQACEAFADKGAVSKNGTPDRSFVENVQSTVETSSLFGLCRSLFADYPLAVNAAGRGRLSSSMILGLLDGIDFTFFVLSRNRGLRGLSYSLRPWRAAGTLEIQPRTVKVPEVVMNALNHGVPLPRDGSVFGCRSDQDITALVTFNMRYETEHPEPSWAMMPFADLPETQWPAFTGGPVLGRWFWDDHQAGIIVWLDRLITRNPRTVYWVDTRKLFGWDCCVIAHDITARDGFTLRSGRYVYYQVLRAGKTVPALDALLADADKIDLAPRFRQSTFVRS